MIGNITVGNVSIEVSGSAEEIMDVVKKFDVYLEEVSHDDPFTPDTSNGIIINQYDLVPYQYYFPPEFQDLLKMQ